jgi:RNA polymerase subunit RPABC4/transcription elongation factor Spt4
MNGFTYLLFLAGLWFGLRTLLRNWDKADSANWRDEEIERTRRVLERDPTNSGTRAKMAGFLIEDGDLEAGIHEYRTAISSSPHGPFTTEWKRKLRDALDVQEKLARGERIPGFNEWRVCEKCQATLSVKEKTCTRCGATISRGFMEWTLDKQTQREIWGEALPFAVVLIVAFCIFSTLPFEWKGTIIISTTMVMGYLFLRSFDK